MRRQRLLVAPRPPRTVDAVLPQHGSPTVFTVGIERPGRHGRLGRGATMIRSGLTRPMRLGLATNRFERGVCVRVLGVGHAPAVGPLTNAWVTERIRAIHEASGGTAARACARCSPARCPRRREARGPADGRWPGFRALTGGGGGGAAPLCLASSAGMACGSGPAFNGAQERSGTASCRCVGQVALGVGRP